MVHESASSGYRNRADTYQQARPSYHPALISRFVERYGRGVVVDIGAGTGIFTAQIVEAGVGNIAVEPVAEMRSLLAASLPDVEVRDGTAESIPLGDDAADTVVAAQAFHWFDHRAALDEIHRVIKADGHLVTVWNVRDESESWVSDYTAVVDRYEGETPRHRTMQWRDAIESDHRFELVDDWAVDNPKLVTVDDVVARALSTSFIAALPEGEQREVAERIRRLVEPHGPTVTFPYRSELQAWRRR